MLKVKVKKLLKGDVIYECLFHKDNDILATGYLVISHDRLINDFSRLTLLQAGEVWYITLGNERTCRIMRSN